MDRRQILVGGRRVCSTRQPIGRKQCGRTESRIFVLFTIAKVSKFLPNHPPHLWVLQPRQSSANTKASSRRPSTPSSVTACSTRQCFGTIFLMMCLYQILGLPLTTTKTSSPSSNYTGKPQQRLV